MAAITPKNGRVDFVAAHDPHCYWELNTTNLGTNYGDDTTGVDDNTAVVAGDISTSDSYQGMNNQNDPPASSWFDLYVVTDAAMLLYLPSGLTVGNSYGLYHNGGGTHAQMGVVLVTATGIQVALEHNNGGTNQDNMKFEIPNADLDGWHCVSWQFSSEGGAQGDMGLWHNGTKVCDGTRGFQLAYGSGNPDFGAAAGDAPLASFGDATYGVDADWPADAAITGTGILIANFTCDNPNQTNTTAPGNGDTWHSDYYDDHVVVAASDPAITDVDTDEIIAENQTNVVLTGTDFEAAQGTGDLELGSQATYGGTLVSQSIDTWSATSIQFDVTRGGLGLGTVYAYVTNDTGDTNATGFAITLTGTPVTVTDVDTDETIVEDQTNVVLTGTQFLASQGTGKVELCSASNYTGTIVGQSIDTWSNTSIQFDVTRGALSIGTVYAFVTNDDGTRNTTGLAVTLSAAVTNDITYGTYTFDTQNDTDCQAFTYTSINGGSGQTTAGVISSAGTAAEFCHDTNGGNSAAVGPSQGEGGVGDGYLYTECSSPGANNDTYTMTFDTVLDASTHTWEIDFYTSQRGPAIGNNHSTCAVQINENSGGWTTITTFGGSGQDTTDGTVWVNRTVDLSETGANTDSSTEVRLLITTNGPTNAWHADYGIDTVTISGVAISAPEVTPAVTDVDDEDLEITDVNLLVTGTDFIATQGSGDLELGDTATYTGTLVSQSIDSWSDTSIQFDVVKGALDYGTNYVYVTNSDSNTNAVGYSVNLYVQHQITGTNQVSDQFQSGTQIIISGSNFGSTQGTSTVELNTAANGSGSSNSVTVDSWSNSSITATVYLGALSPGTLYLIVNRDDSTLGDTTARSCTGYQVTVYIPGSSDGLYQTSEIVNTIRNTGITLNIFMISDE